MSVLGFAAVDLALGQTVTKVPNNFGLEIESVSVDAAASTAKVAVHNSSGRPVTAYVIGMSATYSDGEVLDGEGLIDFFAGLGLKHLFPEGPGTDPNIDAMQRAPLARRAFRTRSPDPPAFK
jgi:hypothetical protein